MLLRSGIGGPRANRVRARAGLTLIELILVVVILGVLATAVIPSFSKHSPRYLLNASGLRLQALLRMARSYAIRKGRTVRLAVSLSSGSACFEVADGNYPVTDDFERVGCDWARDFRPEGETEFGETSYWSEDACSCEGFEHVYFYPDGSAGPSEVCLLGAAGDTLGIAIARTTGRLKLRRSWEEAK